MILFRLNMVVVIKFLVRLFIKGSELNPYKISEKHRKLRRMLKEKNFQEEFLKIY